MSIFPYSKPNQQQLVDYPETIKFDCPGGCNAKAGEPCMPASLLRPHQRRLELAGNYGRFARVS